MARKRDKGSAQPRKRMSNKAFHTLVTIPLVLLVIIGVALVAVANVMPSTLDTFLGKGTSSVEQAAGTEDWDTAYYDAKYASTDEARDAAYQVAAQVQDEGTVLLKNDGVLPLAKGSTVMPFGRAYLSPIYGQLSSGGSGKWAVDPVTPEQGLDAFSVDTAAADRMSAAADPEGLTEAEGTLPAGQAGSVLGGDCKIYEYDPSIYEGLASEAGTTGIVFITRSGQEGQDQKFDAYADGTPHYLALSQNERGTIKAAKETCDHVVVVLVSSAPMEMGELQADGGELSVDAILWYGHPGEKGFSQLSALLDGDVNPSGRTVDIWPADFTADPSYAALGVNTYTNLSVASGSMTNGGELQRTYNEYQEGVYMGYRYYETADAVDESFDYDAAVVYPFGYGLSYTTFTKTLDDVQVAGGQVKATVTVTNTGSVAGKDVVQLYAGAPYTALDAQTGIEKPVRQLAAFDKTKLLAPGESQALTLTFDEQDMGSYSYAHQNSDGTTGCYVLEAGDYEVSLREDSHDAIDSRTVTVAETTWFDGSDEAHIRNSERDMQSELDDEGKATGEAMAGEFVAATNQFQTSTDYMTTDSHILTRSDWAGTQPVAEDSKEIGQEFADQTGIEVSFDPATDPELGNVEGSKVYASEEPASGADNGLAVSDLRGADYDDPRWDQLLDQIDWAADANGIKQNFAGDAYTTAAINSIGLPATVDEDGANGLKVQGSDNGYDMSKSSSFGFAPLMASTWNRDLLYEVGAAFGQEALAHGISGWYAPAINLHRSPFSGRVFEYYSEDPVLSGELAARVISGAGDQGMYCYLKHFALNETETGRADMILTWADEQTMRELYMRPFEIALRDARMTVKYTADETGATATRVMRAGTALMAAQNCVGTTAGECNYALLTSVLRGEWGFHGMVISDYWVWNGNNLRDLALRAGCDTYLCMNMPAMWSISDYDSPTARASMRTAIHNLAYAVANSNALQGVAPGSRVVVSTSPWVFLFAGVEAVIVALVILGAWRMRKRSKDELAHPELYKRGRRAEAKLQRKLAQGK